jgi:septal ring factor EnvC (AmiA/AmiB activator)
LLPLDERTAGQQPVNARTTPVRKAVDPALVNALESHIKTLQGDNDALREQLAASEARGERLAADYAARDAKSAAELDAERERADKAIATFAALADRLDALAAERSKPWWRRLVG